MPRSHSIQRETPTPTAKTDEGPPKVFLSHASEDKNRFVVDFATRLRQRGIDVWLDQWEMLPGDSLVRKIFDEGLARAVAVIVVISEHSVAKPWVREELDIAVVRKINQSSKLIPVVIDECAVPECLQATIWEKISDIKNYEPSLERIVMSIFGRSNKPPVAAGPAFSEQPVVPIGDLTPVDSRVLQTACEVCLSDGYSLSLLESDLFERTRKVDLSDEVVRESVLILKSRGYLVMEFPASLRITFAGFEIFLRSHRPDYEKLLKQFVSLVINDGLLSGDAIEKAMRLPRVLLDQIVEVFAERKWLIVERYGGGKWEIVDGGTSPEMKRWLTA